MKNNLRFLAFYISTIIMFGRPAAAAPGDVDSGFGNSGRVLTSVTSANDSAQAVAIQSDGKILVAGYPNMALVRYNPNGSLDTSFNGDGKATQAFAGQARALALQSDGKILVAGSVSIGGKPQMGVIRYNPTGALDATFNGVGYVALTFSSNSSALAFGIAVQRDGKIVVVGNTVTDNDSDMALARLHSNGTLDTSFNGTGKIVVSFGSAGDVASCVAVQSDGRIVAAGWAHNGSNEDIAVLRFNPDGSWDTSFNGSGKVTTAIGTALGSSITLQSDQKIVVAGASHNGVTSDFALVRYNSNGTLDTSFNRTGKIVTDLQGGSEDHGRSVVVQSNGKILIAGDSSATSSAFALVRYNSDGMLDAGFGENGKLVGPSGMGWSAALQRDGKIVVAGSFATDFAVVRYEGDPAPPIPSITSVSPNPVTGSNTAQPFTIHGADFVFGANIVLRDDTAGQTFANRVASSFSNTRIVLNPVFTTAPHDWTVEIINPDGKSSGQFPFRATSPQLAPTLLSPGASANSGATVETLAPTFTWAEAAGATRYGFYISKEPYGAVHTLHSETSLTGTAYMIPSGKLVAGTKYRWVMTAFDSAGRESEASRPLYFQTAGETAAAPDLVVEAESILFGPANVNAGGTFNLKFRVRNVGSAPSLPSQARIRLSADSVLTSRDIGLEPLDVNIPALPANSSAAIEQPVRIPPSVQPGSYFPGVFVDPLSNSGQTQISNDGRLATSGVTVLQAGAAAISALPDTRSISAAGGNFPVAVTATGGAAPSWTASVDGVSWLRVANGSAGRGTGSFTVAVAPNPSAQGRSGSVRIAVAGASKPVNILVTQLGLTASTSTSFSLSNIPFPRTAGTPFTVTVSAVTNSGVIDTTFTGRVTLAATAAIKLIPSTVTLVNGTWTGSVTASDAASSCSIRASADSISGVSNLFNILPAHSSSCSLTLTVVGRDGKTPVAGATVRLQKFDFIFADDIATKLSGADGRVVFTELQPGDYRAWASQSSNEDADQSAKVEFRSLKGGSHASATLKLRSKKPPVLLVPGIGGSGVNKLGWPRLRTYPAPRNSLHIVNVYGVLGWGDLRDALSLHFEVFDAPWDWRMPVMAPGGDGQLAWKYYLKEYIRDAKTTGHEKVYVVAHSMGGLLVRSYVQSAEYADDIEKLAMIGTPNAGSALAYYLWYGGDDFDVTYRHISDNLYEDSGKPGEWSKLTQTAKRKFYRENVPTLGELLPTYPFIIKPFETSIEALPELRSSSFAPYELNHATTLERFTADKSGANRITTKVFYSTSEKTIRALNVREVTATDRSKNIPYDRYVPVSAIMQESGDGTVLSYSSVLDDNLDGTGAQFASNNSATGGHMFLPRSFAYKVSAFLNPDFDALDATSRPERRSALQPVATATTKPLLNITVIGEAALFVAAPDGKSSGIRPADGIYTNEIAQAEVESNSEASSVTINAAGDGVYTVQFKAAPGEMLTTLITFGEGADAKEVALRWIGSGKVVQFDVLVGGDSDSPLYVFPSPSAPTAVQCIKNDGNAFLTWSAPEGVEVAEYRIYARRDDQPTYSQLATVHATSFQTADAWRRDEQPPSWSYVVVAVDAAGHESPYEGRAQNSAALTARFTVSAASGTAPMHVSFRDESSGLVTAWEWDFDGDGVTDSTDQNPTVYYAQAGAFQPSLTVSGPDGTDTYMAAAGVSVNVAAEPGRIQFPARSFFVDESSGMAAIPVERTGGAGVASVEYHVKSRSAKEGRDFSASFGTLSFDPGSGNATIFVPITNDGLAEAAEEFEIVLRSPSGAALGGNARAEVVIIDADLASYRARRGTYVTALFGSSPSEPLGTATLSISKSGVFSGKIWAAGKWISLVGRLDANGAFEETAGGLDVYLKLDLAKLGGPLLVTVTDGSTALQGEALHAAKDSGTRPGLAERLTFLVAPPSGEANLPGGYGFGAAVVSSSGRVRFAGKLGDGTPVAAGSRVDAAGRWPISLAPYKGRGLFAGNIDLSSADGDHVAIIRWQRPAMKQSPALVSFEAHVNVEASRYVPPPPGVRVFASWSNLSPNGELSFLDTNSPALSPRAVFLSHTNKTLSKESSGVALTISRSSGLFTGKIQNVDGRGELRVSGAVLQSREFGAGLFQIGRETGAVILNASPYESAR